jgi:hypothetical protein
MAKHKRNDNVVSPGDAFQKYLIEQCLRLPIQQVEGAVKTAQMLLELRERGLTQPDVLPPPSDEGRRKAGRKPRVPGLPAGYPQAADRALTKLEQDVVQKAVSPQPSLLGAEVKFGIDVKDDDGF